MCCASFAVQELRPNPSLERDLHRHGTWPARRSLSSFASQAKHHSGSGPSAQTLGRTANALQMQASSSTHCEVNALGAAKCFESSTSHVKLKARECLLKTQPSSVSSFAHSVTRRWLSIASRWFVLLHAPLARAARPLAGGSPSGGRGAKQELQFFVSPRPAGRMLAPVRGRVPSARSLSQALEPPLSEPRAKVRPNPSLERTSTGLALGPRASQCHHPSRGPSTNPVASAQLKR